MPTLEWIGKEKVINHHQEVPFRVLDRQYSFDENGQHAGDNGSENMIIHGDNLDALKALLPRYEGRVKCIYIDPPYNTGNEGWVYNDNVNDPKIRKWLGEVVGKEGEDLTRHDKWLCMMYPRLKLLQKLLAEDGVILFSQLKFLYPLKTLAFPAFSPPRFGPFPSFFPLREEMRETFFRPSLQPYPVALRKFAWPLWWRGRKCSSWYLHQNVPAAPAHPWVLPREREGWSYMYASTDGSENHP